MFNEDDEYKRNSPKSVPNKRSSSSLSNLAKVWNRTVAFCSISALFILIIFQILKEGNKHSANRVLIPSLDFSTLDTAKRDGENKKP